ncbi:TM0106 family RecB-like putative nuclease [Nocardioides sp. Y6]|uniref:TM0106 family RecB-like putative nuclease n=1 Tax=Nocardioides malaquae TaxID=2773426 RepID=A0ABR9RVQ9_9ACTN|nr:bifunctional RecB family nuclease/DEAD/DEAH box helicase [Nocardioides malaquae]MBE7325687.1 TM0106 family RecB-like putative nuclease [Nocardioides malaquae]
MFLIDDALHWSASDLTAAAECEYRLLRTLDQKLGRVEALEDAGDPFMDHIATLGDVHEERLLSAYRAEQHVVSLPPVEPPYTAAKLAAAHAATLAALEGDADVIHQAAFSDGEFFGYADFVERTDAGWLVADAKLARSAKPKALVQLGAYADQVERMGVPLAPEVALLLGNGERVTFRVDDVRGVFHERRDRLRHLLGTHRSGGVPVAWGDERYVACGRCAECQAAITDTDDVLLVAGLSVEHRRRLHEVGVRTVQDLATATTRPEQIAPATFERLRAQAALQWKQMSGGDDAPVTYELKPDAADTLARMPAPSQGDLFFDFEGDPMYDEGDPRVVGLEYLWGVLDTDEKYLPIWAHTRAQERDAFTQFVDLVNERRALHPDLHVYHYAPYETTALKRLAMRYQVKEDELDDLLRAGVFVDLFATVKGAIRVSQPSYSIKKLEPLYMGDELRSDDEDAVGDGAASVLAYHEYRDWISDQPEKAAKREAALADYNEYDCLSTLRLRDWLLERAAEAGVRGQITPSAAEDAEPTAPAESASAGVVVEDPLFDHLMARSGPTIRKDRTPEQQAYAMLANALDYHRREDKQYWWEHLERLSHPLDEWVGHRDVFCIEAVEVLQEWAVPEGRATNSRRVLRVVGDWSPGSKEADQVQAVYAVPGPSQGFGPERAPFTACGVDITRDPDDPRVITITESCKPDAVHSAHPVALVPGPPPRSTNLQVAITEVCSAADAAPSLPERAVLDLLARRTPRTHAGAALPRSGHMIDDVVGALLAMDDSYVAIQGPPGTGKTYSGSRVVRTLVKQHGWRVGVVAQSHAVVENMLAGVVKAGLDPGLVGKAKTKSNTATWTELQKVAPWLEEQAGGCVVGGTVFDFANPTTIPRDTLDLIVVDEAGQFSLAATLAASVAGKRLLLLGDPQQLPQVSKGSHAEPVDTSALGWLMEGSETLDEAYGYFLGETFRMHPALTTKVSRLSYENRLHVSATAPQRRLDGTEPGLEVVHVAHTGCRTESPAEADEVVTQVQAHLGRTWHDPDDSRAPRPLEPGDFLVVAPYNAQVQLIRAALDAAGLTGVRVGTVDKFQGQEAPIALVSMTASSHGDVPRGMGFVLSRNRVNVAVSRAQWKAVVIRSHALTSYMPRSAKGVEELGAFIGLCRG